VWDDNRFLRVYHSTSTPLFAIIHTRYIIQSKDSLKNKLPVPQKNMESLTGFELVWGKSNRLLVFFFIFYLCMIYRFLFLVTYLILKHIVCLGM